MNRFAVLIPLAHNQFTRRGVLPHPSVESELLRSRQCSKGYKLPRNEDPNHSIATERQILNSSELFELATTNGKKSRTPIVSWVRVDCEVLSIGYLLRILDGLLLRPVEVRNPP
jgi:hypothetical protein